MNEESARATVERIRELHAPLDRGDGARCKGCSNQIVQTPWPCRTIAAIENKDPR